MLDVCHVFFFAGWHPLTHFPRTDWIAYLSIFFYFHNIMSGPANLRVSFFADLNIWCPKFSYKCYFSYNPGVLFSWSVIFKHPFLND